VPAASESDSTRSKAEVGTAVRIAGKRTDSGHEGMIQRSATTIAGAPKCTN
jgi:hypothetical protein